MKNCDELCFRYDSKAVGIAPKCYCDNNITLYWNGSLVGGGSDGLA